MNLDVKNGSVMNYEAKWPRLQTRTARVPRTSEVGEARSHRSRAYSNISRPATMSRAHTARENSALRIKSTTADATNQ